MHDDSVYIPSVLNYSIGSIVPGKIILPVDRAFNSLSAQNKSKFSQLGSLSYFERKVYIIWCKWGWMRILVIWGSKCMTYHKLD